MEGSVYRCKWSKRDDLYQLELVENPQLSSSAENLQKAIEILCDGIIEWNGDGEAVIEFFPPLRKKDCAAPDFLELEFVDVTDAINAEELYNDGFCETCKSPVGERTDRPIELDSLPKKAVLAVKFGKTLNKIYSLDVIKLVSDPSPLVPSAFIPNFFHKSVNTLPFCQIYILNLF